MNTLFDVSDRLAFITGSSRGLGLALATGLAEAGARVILHGRDTEALAAAQGTIQTSTGTKPSVATFDVTDAEAVAAGVREVIERDGVPDILVNNAGVQRRAPFAEFAVKDWDDIVAANLSSAFYVSRQIAPGMQERRSGKIINIASVQSQLARQTIAPYGATKGGLVQLTKGMAADLARHNVQVNAISPGYLATEMNRALVEDSDFTAWLEKRTPAQRWGKVEELVGTLIYLSSDASNFVSGQNVFVDGGMTAVV